MLAVFPHQLSQNLSDKSHEKSGTNSLFIIFFMILTLMYLYMFAMLLCQ